MPSDHVTKALTDLERQVGQTIVIGFNGQSVHDASVRTISDQLHNGTIGGVILLGRNIQSPAQVHQLVGDLTNHVDPTPFISVDQEGGAVQRLQPRKGFPRWPSAAEFAENTGGCAGSNAQEQYATLARGLRALGINLNFGPVVDLNINLDNPIIGHLGRSYSDKSETVSRCGGMFISAHHAVNILTSLKHFPGHGSSKQDSHTVLPDITDVWQPEELVPFQQLAQTRHADMIMMAHLVHPDFSDAPGTPASMSRKATRQARAIAGQTTILITDDLEMDAISSRMTVEQAAIAAIAAGNDMIIASSYGRNDPNLGRRINQAIVRAVMSGRIPKDQIHRSYERIRAAKARLTNGSTPSSVTPSEPNA
ncbi:glycoside hydrolase family 3 protein [Roseibium hamelinense]|nr:glycoside hydrolase family 3 protein [Roseibium hamelinense]